MPLVYIKPKTMGGSKTRLEDDESRLLVGIAKEKGGSVLYANFRPAEAGGHIIDTYAGQGNERAWFGKAGSEYIINEDNPGPIFVPDRDGTQIFWVSAEEEI